jgi:hypothetical protein
MVFSEDLGSCIPAWKNPSKKQGCKWGLLEDREREIQREHGGVQVGSVDKAACSSFSGSFKTYSNPRQVQTQVIPTQ